MSKKLPIKFEPLYKERVWGGRLLATRYGRELPSPGTPYGESWELCDREDDQTVVSAGEYQGLTLNDLWSQHRETLFGAGYEDFPRFPLLIKILDCQEDLSIQVHPPANVAGVLGGEPKTEMWYIAGSEPFAKLYVGLREGVTEDVFRSAISEGAVESCIQTFNTKAGDSIFLESGVVHAIGAGHLIFEIQQNSDTTYRVYDWERLGLDGVPRDLHIEESMQSILWGAQPPELISNQIERGRSELFVVNEFKVNSGSSVIIPNPSKFAVLNIVEGALLDAAGNVFTTGASLLIPLDAAELRACEDATVLITQV